MTADSTGAPPPEPTSARESTARQGSLRQHLVDAWQTVVPPGGGRHGPLPPLLIGLTVVTGLVDAFSYLSMGRVFVANMTGNVVFSAFALGGAPGFVWWASLLAIAAFLLGALLGGRVRAHWHHHRGRHLLVGVALQAVLVLCCLVLTWVLPLPEAGRSYDGLGLVALILLLGAGMGLQNATARAIAVPDLTTTVLTLTLTGLSADSRVAGGPNSRLGRRLVSVVSMFVGGLAGVLLIQAGHGRWVLVLTLVILLLVVVTAARTRHADAEWVRGPG